MIPPRHLTPRARLILIIVSAALLGIGAFITLMRDLERSNRNESASSQAVSAPVNEPVATSSTNGLPLGAVTVGDRTIPVELALDPASQEQGLSDRADLPADEGMLFIFDLPQTLTFWMNRMRFPIDMVFINGTKVVRVAANVPAPAFGEFPSVVSSGAEADKVLEINAGKAAEWGIEEGTELEISENCFH